MRSAIFVLLLLLASPAIACDRENVLLIDTSETEFFGKEIGVAYKCLKEYPTQYVLSNPGRDETKIVQKDDVQYKIVEDSK